MNRFIFLLLLLSGCKTTKFNSPIRRTPDYSQKPTADSTIIDPLTDPSIQTQTHIMPFSYILFSVLLICFIPYIYIKLSPYVFKWLRSIRNNFRKN